MGTSRCKGGEKPKDLGGDQEEEQQNLKKPFTHGVFCFFFRAWKKGKRGREGEIAGQMEGGLS